MSITQNIHTIHTEQIEHTQDIGDALMRRFLAFLDAGPRTVSTYTRALRQLTRYLREQGVTHPRRPDILRYRDDMQTRLSAATVQNYMTVTRLFFRWTAQEGLYPNVADNIKGSPVSRGFKKDYLTTAQVSDMLAGINRVGERGLRDYALLSLMVTGGLRAIEAARADVGDMRALGDGMVLYIQGKGMQDKTEYVKLPHVVERALREYLRARGANSAGLPLFGSVSNQNRGDRLTTRAISGIVKNRLRAIGLDSTRLSAHSLRHTAGTLNLLNGGTLEETQQLLRHSNINTTMIYLHHLERAGNMSEARIAGAIFGE